MQYKGYAILQDKPTRLYHIIKEGKGGSIPNEFIGLYTTKTEALVKIDTYLAQRGVKKNDSEADTTRD